MLGRTLLLGALLSLLLSLAVPARAGGPARDATYGLSVSVIQHDGTPIRDRAWVEAQIQEANALFGPLGVHFRRTAEAELDPKFSEIRTPNDRDALSSAIHDAGHIPVFIVDALEDVDEKGRMRMGVCWRRRYVIVAAHAKPTVLAHELGHLFGNGHSKVDDNLMSYSRTGKPVFLDARQSAVIVATSAQYLDSGRFKDIGAP